ncbi:hypothetical protein WICPIJ_002995 [Wickerhamomyces pijperi]|uniref:Uncharacterized protein n=1 Tax=Wickerhamomyces pijperi TaxID=599730 RepID=A0A9P8TP36_WICPI|nr:hypothetical protein WICPIJ_002995 [Wickerhamomyces pijperi]
MLNVESHKEMLFALTIFRTLGGNWSVSCPFITTVGFTTAWLNTWVSPDGKRSSDKTKYITKPERVTAPMTNVVEKVKVKAVLILGHRVEGFLVFFGSLAEVEEECCDCDSELEDDVEELKRVNLVEMSCG